MTESTLPRLALVAAAFFLVPTARAADWPEWLGAQRDGIWRETGLVEKFPPGGPPVVWRAPVGPGYSGPWVAAGRVSLRAPRLATAPDGKPLGNPHGTSPGGERVICLDAS